ncbi:MAG: histidine phosphatase family protein, partial [Acidobacteriota bacterium]|nr:histidine phosphatase family protein [Acidobacteriota bacterium]
MRRVPDPPQPAGPGPVAGPGRWDPHPVPVVRTAPPAVILLVRPGQTTTNARQLLVGRSDPELTELGERQARALAALLEGA